MENPRFLQVGNFQYSAEAYIIKGKLEANGIEVQIRDNHTVDSNPLYSVAVGGVKLFVEQSDFDAAQKILAGVSEFSVDDKGKALLCPKCHSAQVEIVTSIRDFKSLISFIFTFAIGIFLVIRHRYRCSACHFEFETE